MDTDLVASKKPSTNAKSARNRGIWFAFFWGLAVFGFLAILCLSGLFYMVLVQSKDEIAAAISGESSADISQNNSIILNQIAFIGNDSNVWLVSPDGQQKRALTNDAEGEFGYSFPTWAPDGKHIAFIGPQAANNPALFVSSTDSIAPKTVYASLNSAPFYLYWSPNSEEITFLTQERSGLSMRLANIINENESRILEKGSPFYWAWSPESDKLLMHVGGARALSEGAHLSILDNRENAQRIELQSAPGRFQAPVWSSNGRYTFYVAEDEAGNDAIFRMDMRTLQQDPIVDLRGGGRTYIVISPSNESFAYLEADANRPIPLGRPYLVDADGETRRLITHRTVMSMYWSPDGSKLALLTVGFDDGEPSVKGAGLAAPLAQEVNFRWWVYDIEAQTLVELLKIEPTLDFLQTVPYFDQYHLSLTFWSPDGRYFVATTNVSEEQDGEVIVLDTTGEESPRQIGQGRLAVWSWN